MSEESKLRRNSSPPVARTGAGDISERELSRERSAIATTPPARIRVHPKKQLFSVPVSKFTTGAGSPPPSKHLKRIKSCLDELRTPPAPPADPVSKAMSMEDLTPSKRVKTDKVGVARRWSSVGAAERQAAGVVTRFMVLSAWRRRRDEVRCLRRTLESQVSCSERLRVQVYALKSLLDSDNAKVRLAMRELDRLKQLLRDKEMETTVLKREKSALEGDVSVAEDKASEMSIGWRNCRNELEGARAALAVCEHALTFEKAATTEARARTDRAKYRISELEELVSERSSQLSEAAAAAAALRRDRDDKQRRVEEAERQLKAEREARALLSRQCAALTTRVASGEDESRALRGALGSLQAEIARLDAQLCLTRQQLEWWPKPLTRFMGAARAWCGRVSLAEVLMWSALPARHGC